MMVPLTLVITKTAARLSRVLGRGGGHALPGVIAERLDPHLAHKLAKGLPKGVIIVTGTNGKTTTTKLIYDALTAGGERVLTNNTGSNLKRGITSALIADVDYSGHTTSTIGLFEVDEASVRLVAPELNVGHIVVLNLFRDQLDRYGELDTTAALIGEGIASTNAKLYLNADDPLVASLSKYATSSGQVAYFGIEGMPAAKVTGSETVVDSDRCPVCRERLLFSRTFYGHIGHYRCPTGDFVRPQPAITITSVEEATIEGSEFTLAFNGKRTSVHLPLPGTYNLYNGLAAAAVGFGFGLEVSSISKSLSAARAAFGRVERIELKGRALYLLLIKNPAGFTQVLETFLLGEDQPTVLMLINDDHADGRDVSWLWDVPLEALAKKRPRVIVSGVRGSDMRLRLHYAGITSTSAETFEEAVKKLIDATPEGGTAYILPTYTAMIAIRKALSKQTEVRRAGR